MKLGLLLPEQVQPGIAIIKLLMSLGLKDVILCDRTGAIYEGRRKIESGKGRNG